MVSPDSLWFPLYLYVCTCVCVRDRETQNDRKASEILRLLRESDSSVVNGRLDVGSPLHTAPSAAAAAAAAASLRLLRFPIFFLLLSLLVPTHKIKRKAHHLFNLCQSFDVLDKL